MKVVVSPEAWESYTRTLIFYSEEWSDVALAKLDREVIAKLKYLAHYPTIGAYEDLVDIGKDGIRYRRVIVRHLKVIYKIVRNEIHVTDIFDTRQDPRKMKG